MNKLVILLLYFLLTVTAFPYTTTGQVLDPAMIGSYIDRFNMQDKELYVQQFQTDRQKNSYPAIYRYSNVRTKT